MYCSQSKLDIARQLICLVDRSNCNLHALGNVTVVLCCATCAFMCHAIFCFLHTSVVMNVECTRAEVYKYHFSRNNSGEKLYGCCKQRGVEMLPY